MSESERNCIRTDCVSCSKIELLINLKLEYQEAELICEACNVKRDNLHEEIEKFLGGTTAFCPRKCGFRGKLLEIKHHEASCRKNVPRFLCLFCSRLYLERVKLYKAQDLVKHIKEQHSNNVTLLENLTEYRFPLTVESNTSLLQLNNLNNIELYWLQITEKDKTVYMFIKHIFSLKAVSHNENITFRRFSIESKLCKSVILNGNIVPANTSHIDVENDNFIEITALKNANVLLALHDTLAEQLPKKFLSELECDICVQVLTAPIRLCNAGHSLCDFCFKKVNRCPKCKANLSKARNYALERIVNQINIDCKNRDAGCKGKFNAEELQNHMSKCQFRSFNCTDCINSIYYKDLVNHAHCLAPKTLGTVYSLIAQSPIRFLAFDELFILHINPCDACDENDCMHGYRYDNIQSYQAIEFCVENFTSLKDIQFYFDLTISDKVDGKSITFSAKCRKDDIVEVPEDYFKEVKDLVFSLNIYEKLDEKSSKKIIEKGNKKINTNTSNKNELDNFILDCLRNGSPKESIPSTSGGLKATGEFDQRLE